MTQGDVRPAFYALAPGGWRDYVTLLHPPYTLWHLAYVAIGAALAPQWRPGVLALALLAFFLGMGIGAHALDELRDRPLRTRIPDGVLIALAVVSIGAACAIGVVVATRSTLWLLAFVAFGGVIVVAYNLELFGGALHTDLWFAGAWGAFPLLTGFFASAERVRAEAVTAAAFALLVSLAQRRLSTEVRRVRRNDSELPADADLLLRAPETALRLLSVALPTLAGALLLMRAG
ncbi:MAG: hypothetical protein ACXVFJ_03840 [Gaiellaceae bacterium]